MRRVWIAILGGALFAAPAPTTRAQTPVPPAATPDPVAPSPPPALPPTPCVASFGHNGCAARLFAQILCDTVGGPISPAELQQRLQTAYDEARIDQAQLRLETIEGAAYRYYPPQLCPAKSREILELQQFLPARPPPPPAATPAAATPTAVPPPAAPARPAAGPVPPPAP